ncbi:PREDICTED: vesicle-associated membrane protein 5 [Ceratotherium simum simum]|uniref:Vesicle-associated membrane protein 5 n=1 Tax=Ceratotherium simum simum TaxID=73337 RepID=A0ABM1D8T9_CERSS|nr:PREDICTED: vesicle-associated membrane protein 5 [Ceratotherium simum simum]
MGASCSPDLGLDAQAGKELERCQRQADEVTEIMLNNYNKVLERHGNLEELDQRAHQLLGKAENFNKTTEALAKKKRCENTRYLALAVGVLLLIILIVLLIIFLPHTHKGSSAPQAQDTGITPGD